MAPAGASHFQFAPRRVLLRQEDCARRAARDGTAVGAGAVVAAIISAGISRCGAGMVTTLLVGSSAVRSEGSKRSSVASRVARISWQRSHAAMWPLRVAIFSE